MRKVRFRFLSVFKGLYVDNARNKTNKSRVFDLSALHFPIYYLCGEYMITYISMFKILNSF